MPEMWQGIQGLVPAGGEKDLSEMLLIDNEFRALIPPLQPDELEGLEQSLIKEGCRDALVVWSDQNILVDGHHRYDLCQKHNIPFQTIERQFSSRENAMVWIIQNQFGRRNINAYQRSVLALKLEEIFTRQAKARQEATQLAGKDKEGKPLVASVGQNSGRPKKVANNKTTKTKPAPPHPRKPRRKEPTQSSKQRTTRKLAKVADVSHDTINKVKKIQEKATTEEKAKLATGEASIREVYTRVKRLEENKAVAEQKVTKPMPVGQYSILLADPPWESDFSPTSARRTQRHYPTRTLDELKALKVPAAENAMLFLWTTAPMLKQALELMDAWSFEYRTNAVWDKEVFGTGYYFRSQHELLLVGKKGEFKAPAERNRSSSVIREKRRTHSQKPEVTYEIIEKMYPGEKYLELFSRNQRKGWDGWGNEPCAI